MIDKIYEKQHTYYTETADKYDSDHVRPGDEHSIALEYVAQLLRVCGAQSVLDVGAGTGRAVRYLAELRPDLDIQGIEPVPALREQAAQMGTKLLEGYGERLPFGDGSFDAVIATGVLHHVPDPAPVIEEMLRVASRAVFISDSNRFGQGSRSSRFIKLSLNSLKCWNAYQWIRTRGKRYMVSKGDGVFYSYSIYDSLPRVNNWADRSFIIPTTGVHATKFGPVLDATHGVLVGMKEPSDAWAAKTI